MSKLRADKMLKALEERVKQAQENKDETAMLGKFYEAHMYDVQLSFLNREIDEINWIFEDE